MNNLFIKSPPKSPNIKVPRGIFTGRVRYTILDDVTKPKIFKDFGGWSSLGGVFFSSISAPNPNKDITSDNFAYPLFPNQKFYPLKNEIIYIIPLPDNEIQSSTSKIKYYYFQPLNIWNNTHHNAIPDPIFNSTLPESQKQDYQQTENGIVRRVTDGGTEIDLGENFEEKLEIRPLQPYEGDIIYEGRWGNSIRFGSTIKNSPINNPWSKAGDNGDPITIIRNGQYEEDKEPWIPQVENPNEDISSIYLTSNQVIPIKASSKNYKSYSKKPTSPDKFQGEQIILNSGRLFFNTKEDSILFSSNESINLNSVKSVNIDSPKTILNSKEIYLGDKNANESLILGDKFLNDFQKLLTQLISLSISLQTPIGSPIPFTSNPAIPGPATQVLNSAQQMLNQIKFYKSKTTKTE